MTRNQWFFAIGTVGRDLAAAGLFMNYLLTAVMLTKPLSPAQWGWLTLLIGGARIFDAFLDPLMGLVIDASTSRFGRFKPWLTIGALGSAAMIVGSFNNQLQGTAFLVSFACLYIGFNVFFTMNDVAYWGMLPSLAPSGRARDQLTSVTTLMAGFGALLSNLLVPLLTVGPHAWGGNAVSGYGRIAVVFALVMLGTQAFVVFGVQVPKINSTPAKGHWRTITAVFKQNDQVRWTATILFVYMSVTTLASTMMPIYLYVACGYSGTNVVIFTLLGQVATALVMVSFAQITNRISRKKLLSWAVVASTLGYGGILLAGVFVSGPGKIWWLAGLNVLPAVGNGLFYLVLLITLANVVDYHAWRFGEQRAGIITASRPFVTKIGMALGQLGAMGAYWLTKTLTVTQKIATYERASATGAMSVDAKQNAITILLAQLPVGQGWGLLAIATIVPACGMVFALYMYRNHIILDEGLVEKINSVK